MSKIIRILILLLIPHSFLYSAKLIELDQIFLAVVAIILSLILFIFVNFYIYKAKIKLPIRLRVLKAGRSLFLEATVVQIIQIPISILIYRNFDSTIAITDIVITYLLLILIQINGAIRIFLTSNRLRFIKRVILLIFSWVPVANFLIGLWFCKIVKKEFQYNYIELELQETRASAEICKTKYPLLLLHGLGFRDGKYFFNYWGRVPKLLKQNGATIYYGNQHANASIEFNANEIKDLMLSLKKEYGYEKFNIIAHSKGGLDARYLITSLNMEDSVASLTTISTPHRGSEIISTLEKLSDEKFKKICSKLDKGASLLGDKNPDSLNAVMQLSPKFMKEFNNNNPDSEKVYYQSYATAMDKPINSVLLSIPNIIMRLLSSDNDGLVTIESSKWGKYKGIFKSNSHTGMSHADQIDLFRKEYDGVSIQEEYVQIVKELKEMGL